MKSDSANHQSPCQILQSHPTTSMPPPLPPKNTPAGRLQRGPDTDRPSSSCSVCCFGFSMKVESADKISPENSRARRRPSFHGFRIKKSGSKTVPVDSASPIPEIQAAAATSSDDQAATAAAETPPPPPPPQEVCNFVKVIIITIIKNCLTPIWGFA